MLLKREREEDLVLYDDHGEAWNITLEPAGGHVGTSETDPAGGTRRAIRFVSTDGEPLWVLYDGPATREEELLPDEVVIHFLKAQD